MSEKNEDTNPVEPPESLPPEGFYVVDDETQELLEACVALLGSLAHAQVSEEARNNLKTIADAIIDRFGMDSMELEEIDYDGELLFRPLGGVIPDPDSAEA